MMNQIGLWTLALAGAMWGMSMGQPAGAAELGAKLDVGDSTYLVEPGKETAVRVIVSGPAEADVAIEWRVTDWRGTVDASGTDSVRTDGAGRGTLVLPRDYKRIGIKYVDLTMTHGGESVEGWLSFSYMKSLGAPADGEALVLGLNGGDNDKWLTAAARVGAKLIRSGVDLREIRPHEDKPWDFSRMDARLAIMDRLGLKPMPLVAYGIPWAIPEKYRTYKTAPDGHKYQDDGWPMGYVFPVEAKVWREYCEVFAGHLKGRGLTYEIWNEPDIDGFWRGTTGEYIGMLRTAHEVIHRIDPTAKVGTGGFAFGPEDWLKAVSANPTLQADVLRDAQNAFDVHVLHIHGDFGSFRHRVENFILPARDEYHVTEPMVFNETGYSAHLRGDEIKQAGMLIKKVTYAFSRGAKAYLWFTLYMPREAGPGEYGYGMFREAEVEAMPKAVYPAYRALAENLRGKTFGTQLDLGEGRWGFTFPGKDQTIIYAWQEDESAPSIAYVVAVGGACESVDLMGNSAPAGVVEGKALLIPAAAPVALRFGVAKGGEPRGAVAVEKTPLVRPLTALEMGPDGAGRLEVAVGNPLSRKVAVGLELKMAGRATVSQRVDVDAGKSQNATFDIPAGASVAAGLLAFDVGGAEWRGELPLAIRTVRFVDDSAVEKRDADFVMADRSQVTDFFGGMPDKSHLLWSGPEDLSATVWVSGTRDELTITADVTDDVHVQPNAGADIWRGDSVQIGLAIEGVGGYLEIGAALGDNGKVQTACWSRLDGMADPTPRLEAKVAKTGAGLRYMVSIPRNLLRSKGGEPAKRLRFNLAVNDADTADGRATAMSIAPGLVTGKDPTKFVTLILK